MSLLGGRKLQFWGTLEKHLSGTKSAAKSPSGLPLLNSFRRVDSEDALAGGNGPISSVPTTQPEEYKMRGISAIVQDAGRKKAGAGSWVADAEELRAAGELPRTSTGAHRSGCGSTARHIKRSAPFLTNLHNMQVGRERSRTLVNARARSVGTFTHSLSKSMPERAAAPSVLATFAKNI